MDRIETYYLRADENQRLQNGRGELEFLRTKKIIQQFLPDREGLVVADVGGGTGPYSFWLAEQGHNVSLFDLMQHHVDQALAINNRSLHALSRIEVADVRDLQLEAGCLDVVLLLGPMYHLPDHDDRIKVLRKVRDWLARDGIAFIAYISRFGSLYDGSLRGLFADPEYLEIVRKDLETGVHEPNKDNTRYFTDGYFHHPDEIEKEAESADFQIIDHVAVEGIGWFWHNFDDIWGDQQQREILLEMVGRTDRDRSLLGASVHNILVMKNRDFE